MDVLLVVHGITVGYETMRQQAPKFGQAFANQAQRKLHTAGDKPPASSSSTRHTASSCPDRRRLG
ncbi:MAG: hypothetical protein ACRYHQ_34245 [Janthinobacterium lividum]